jgi:hypothetical protein
MAAYEMYVDTYRTLEYDLQAEIDAYIDALEAHKTTVDVPAPTTYSLVETIVKQYDGEFVLVPAPDPPPLQPLPKDLKYYKSKADRTKIMAAVAAEEKAANTVADNAKTAADNEAEQAKTKQAEAKKLAKISAK